MGNIHTRQFLESEQKSRDATVADRIGLVTTGTPTQDDDTLEKRADVNRKVRGRRIDRRHPNTPPGT